MLENMNGREEIELSDPSIGVAIEECTWREMLWLQKDSVLCVAASDFYNGIPTDGNISINKIINNMDKLKGVLQEEDYIRDYEEFRHIIEG